MKHEEFVEIDRQGTELANSMKIVVVVVRKRGIHIDYKLFDSTIYACAGWFYLYKELGNKMIPPVLTTGKVVDRCRQDLQEIFKHVSTQA